MGALNCVYHRTGFTCRVSWRGTLIGVYLVQRVLLGVDQGDWAILRLYLRKRVYIACISARVFTCQVFRRGDLLAVYLEEGLYLACIYDRDFKWPVFRSKGFKGVELGERAILGMYLGERAKLGLYLGWELYIAYISDRV